MTKRTASNIRHTATRTIKTIVRAAQSVLRNESGKAGRKLGDARAKGIIGRSGAILGPVQVKCILMLDFGGAQGKASAEAACLLARNEAATQPCASPKASPKGDPGKRPPSALLMLAVALATAALRALMAAVSRVT
jgi:hypothetical protein